MPWTKSQHVPSGLESGGPADRTARRRGLVSVLVIVNNNPEASPGQLRFGPSNLTAHPTILTRSPVAKSVVFGQEMQTPPGRGS